MARRTLCGARRFSSSPSARNGCNAHGSRSSAAHHQAVYTLAFQREMHGRGFPLRWTVAPSLPRGMQPCGCRQSSCQTGGRHAALSLRPLHLDSHSSAAAHAIQAKRAQSRVSHLHVPARPAHQHGNGERRDVVAFVGGLRRRGAGADCACVTCRSGCPPGCPPGWPCCASSLPPWLLSALRLMARCMALPSRCMLLWCSTLLACGTWHVHRMHSSQAGCCALQALNAFW